MANVMEVLLASYPKQDLAEKDFEVISDMMHKKVLLLDDAAVVVTDERGVLDIAKKTHKSVRKGVLIGGVVAALTPMGLALGVAAGATGGKLKDLFHKGLNSADLRAFQDFLGANKVCLVLAGPPEAVSGVQDTLQDATGFIHKVIAADSTDVEKVLDEHPDDEG